MIKLVSINNGYDMLNNEKNIDILNEINGIINDTPLPIFKGKSKKQPQIDVVQQMLNTYIKQRLEYLDWESEVDVTPTDFDDNLKSDFRKTFVNKNGENVTVQMEVEFGNAASFYRDVTKIQTSHTFNMADVGIIILPTHSLSKRIDTGLANIEKALREKHILEAVSTIPLIIIGLDDIGRVEWNVKNITNNMEIIKGAKTEYKEKHNKLVNLYIHNNQKISSDAS